MTVTDGSVLLIDDDHPMHDLVKAALASYEVTLLYADDTPQGIQLARDEHPALILLDLLVPAPDLKGWDAVALLKNDPPTADIPIVVVTGAGGDVIQRAMQAGADDFLQKPFTVAQLRSLVTQYLGAPQH